ncbi:class I SAM-dependent methyltransferase [Tropicimonas sp. S265A]|uniref:class I SAM-dependent methyltransferase n=1 Tax=Tropicimonas sp. S265A TaxID=3415134 RepID=UPI003C7D39D4
MHRDKPYRDIEPYWDRIAPKYAAKPVKDEAAYAQKLDHVQALLSAEDRVLEIGCGTGSTALHLAPAVSQIVATDISSAMIAIAEDKRRAAGTTNARFARADASETLYEAPFDVVMSFSLLHLVEDVPGVLDSVYAQLKPGGLFLSKTVCLGDASLSLRLFVRALGAAGLAPPVTPLSRAELDCALMQARFALVEHRYFGKGKLNPFIIARRPA